jgi:hypothetical protein
MKKFWKWLKSLFTKKSGSSKFDYSKLEWLYGGASGFRAVEDTSSAGCRVKSVKLEGTGLRFTYDGSMWGNDYKHPEARMCLFCRTGSRWVGGFWEWGSTGRMYRDFKNIRDHYKGWDPSLVDKASEFAFVVTDKSCSKRSNVVVFGR